MQEMQDSMIGGFFPQFVEKFFLTMFPSRNYPAWAVDALNSVNIRLQSDDSIERNFAE